MCFYYDEYYDAYGAKYVTTRKDHRCCACRKVIPSGSDAKVCSGLSEDGWIRYYVCSRCERMTLAIVVKELNDGCSWNEAWCAPEELDEYLQDRSRYLDPEDPDDCAEYLENEIRPLGMRTLADCRRVVDDMHGRMTGWLRPDDTTRLLMEAS